MELKGKNILASTLTLIFLFSTAFNSFAENWWESKQAGTATDNIQVTTNKTGKVESASRTNWQDGYIEVMAGATADMKDAVNLGHAYSMALKTARHLAYEKLAETVTGINLYSEATYDRELMVDSDLKTVLKAMVRKAQVVDEKKSQFSDGSIWVEVTLGLRLFGEDGLVQPSMAWSERTPVKITPAPKPAPVLVQPVVPQPRAVSEKKYTGLIIDASGLEAAPAMLPRILSEDGEVLYGTGEISRDYIIQYGLMGYQSDLQEAKKMERVGTNPLVVKVKATAGKNRSDFIISSIDVALIKSALAQHNFLQECRVVAVLE